MSEVMIVSAEEAEVINRMRQAKQAEWQPRDANSYGIEEKVDKFEALHSLAWFHYNGVKNGKLDEDFQNYCFEAVMELLGKDVWEPYNKLCEAAFAKMDKEDDDEP